MSPVADNSVQATHKPKKHKPINKCSAVNSYKNQRERSRKHTSNLPYGLHPTRRAKLDRTVLRLLHHWASNTPIRNSKQINGLLMKWVKRNRPVKDDSKRFLPCCFPEWDQKVPAKEQTCESPVTLNRRNWGMAILLPDHTATNGASYRILPCFIQILYEFLSMSLSTNQTSIFCDFRPVLRSNNLTKKKTKTESNEFRCSTSS